MKKVVIVAALGALIASSAVVAAPRAKKARVQTSSMPGVEVTERDSRGRATKVTMDGQTYTVCTSDNSDGCINPREAGLNWGNTPVKHWPGRPISREN
jgi:hypothetical protein